MNRTSMLARMAEEEWDLLVIGGGISGAGVAREAALRGLNVALVEQNDLASGTSCRSGKMIIGGLRYLLNREFHLVRHGLLERDRLVAMAPHLVRWTPYLFPVWAGDPDPLWKIRFGLTLYDLLGRCPAQRRHDTFDTAEVRQLEPGLRTDGLRGAAQYWDGMTDDARLTLETVQAAVAAGAAAANYAQVESFQKHHGRVTGVIICDRLSNASVTIKARTILTAAGPWTDAVRRLDDPVAAPLLRLVKGSFIVVPRQRLPVDRNVTLRAPDKRMTFAVPIRGQTYIGTTEVDFAGDLAAVRVEGAEVSYLLAAAQKAFPEANLNADDIISTWAGLRPLVGSRPGQSASQVTRDYIILRSASGLAILAGGKLTGFRAMGERVVDELFPSTRGKARQSSLGPLPGAIGPLPTHESVAKLACDTLTSFESLNEKVIRYGSQFQALAAELPPNLTASPHAWLLAETRHAVKQEMAQRLIDVLWRRTGTMIFQPGNGSSAAPMVASEMAALLGWPEKRRQEELEEYRRELASMWAWRDAPPAADRPRKTKLLEGDEQQNSRAQASDSHATSSKIRGI